jgi:hypothetical protein
MCPWLCDYPIVSFKVLGGGNRNRTKQQRKSLDGNTIVDRRGRGSNNDSLWDLLCYKANLKWSSQIPCPNWVLMGQKCIRCRVFPKLWFPWQPRPFTKSFFVLPVRSFPLQPLSFTLFQSKHLWKDFPTKTVHKCHNSEVFQKSFVLCFMFFYMNKNENKGWKIFKK